jgi:hypothetical protein
VVGGRTDDHVPPCTSPSLSTTPGLIENEVVDAVAGFLAAGGWEVEQALHGHEPGVDVIARRGERQLHVEAKGGTTTRTGKPMTRSVLTGNVEAAFVKAAIAAARPGVVAAMAFPDIDGYRNRVEPLRPALGQLGISVMWVAEDGAVAVEGPLSDDEF